MRNQKFSRIFLAVLFLLMLGVPLTSRLAPPASFWQPFEQPPDQFSERRAFQTLMDFPGAFAGVFNDHYRLHTQLVNAFHAFRLAALREKEFPNVLIGREDWLYYTGENNLRDYECVSPFTQAELSALVARLQGWDQELRAMGIPFILVIAPNKESIVPQFLPEAVLPGDKNCRVDQVMRAVEKTSLRVLDLRPALRNAARSAQVYHRTDTHWNDLGALIAAGEILKSVKEMLPEVTLPERVSYRVVEREFSGDLARFLPADERFIEQAPFLEYLSEDSLRISEGENGAAISENPGSAQPKALVFRDSFADALIPFLGRHFSRAVFIPAFAVDLELVKREKPDVVILELAQRYLTVLR